MRGSDVTARRLPAVPRATSASTERAPISITRTLDVHQLCFGRIKPPCIIAMRTFALVSANKLAMCTFRKAAFKLLK